MNEIEITLTRKQIAEIAGVGVDAVRMESNKGTFETPLGFLRWTMGKWILK